MPNPFQMDNVRYLDSGCFVKMVHLIMSLLSLVKIKRDKTNFIVYNCHKNKNPSELLTGIKSKDEC